jgi:hypothetical protein
VTDGNFLTKINLEHFGNKLSDIEDRIIICECQISFDTFSKHVTMANASCASIYMCVKTDSTLLRFGNETKMIMRFIVVVLVLSFAVSDAKRYGDNKLSFKIKNTEQSGDIVRKLRGADLEVKYSYFHLQVVQELPIRFPIFILSLQQCFNLLLLCLQGVFSSDRTMPQYCIRKIFIHGHKHLRYITYHFKVSI